MKKVLARIGIGNATVDTVLPSDTVRPGETVDAEVRIEGGSTEQEIGEIRFELETRYRTEEGYREIDIAQYTLAESLTVHPDEQEVRNVSLDIPHGAPVTLGNVDVWVETELDIELAVDPEDKDYLNVQPTPRLQSVFDALDDLGFSLHSAECEAAPHGVFASTRRFVQEFEFRPTSGPFAGELDELEVVPRPGEDALELYLEVDRRGGVLSELGDFDERAVQTTVRTIDASEVRDELASLIRANA
ncbi:sporulation protein [Haloferax sp. KTX1]|uniref:sporulation protein n=1 Tax=Haloferax sp. KTX1 TaxID=2600597 RepID=UPI0011DCAA3A|nr:sporulation protein [Haloferax sp. KTX1]